MAKEKHTGCHAWIPSTGLFNVDGATFRLQQQAGMGVIIRENHGMFIVALSKKAPKLLGPLGFGS